MISNFVGGKREDGTQWNIQLIHCDSINERFSPVTAVFGLVRFDDKLLVVKTARGWDIPGGHIEDGENLEGALARELLEESGCRMTSAQPTTYLRTDYDPRQHTYMLVFEAAGELQHPFIPKHETVDRELMDAGTFLANYTAGPRELMASLLQRG